MSAHDGTLYVHPRTEEQGTCYVSHGGYIAAIIILIILAAIFIGLFIWAFNKDKDEVCSFINISEAEITASNTAITATWKTDLLDEDDTVTLYASTTPIQIEADGTVSGDGVASITAPAKADTVSLLVGQTKNKVTIQKETTYYVGLVAVRKDSCRVSTICDIVFTQSQSDITGDEEQFSIDSLTQKGDINHSGQYSPNSNKDLWTFDGTYLASSEDETMVLCNSGGTLKTMTKDDVPNSALCTWKYNPEGLNRWCLATTSVNTGNRVCMKRNDTSTVINVISGEGAEFKWANITFLDLLDG